jgi:histidinol phosphatase-like PHP family hydrolase
MALNILEDYHVHCSYNDHSAPDLTVPNVVRRAEEAGLRTVAFTEHVRRTSEWIPAYLEEIDKIIAAGSGSRVKVIPGFEAKILRDGSIDCPDEYAGRYFVVASFHTRYGDKATWMNALKTAIENPDVDVIGHLAPEDTFELEAGEVEELGRMLAANGKTVELNAKYRRPPKSWVRAFREAGAEFNLGSDAHSLQEVGNFGSIADLISIVAEREGIKGQPQQPAGEG